MLLELHDLNLLLPDQLRLPTLPGVPSLCAALPHESIISLHGRPAVNPLLAERDNDGL